MSSRAITRDPVEGRRTAYEKLESSGEAQKALWDALSRLEAEGVAIGTKASNVLAKRQKIKASHPK